MGFFLFIILSFGVMAWDILRQHPETKEKIKNIKE